MNAKFKGILEWVVNDLPALVDLDDVDEREDEGTSLWDACQIYSKASMLLDPQPSPCEDELLPVLIELNRIAPEQGWGWEPEGLAAEPGHLSASSGCTEVRVEVKDCALSKRCRYEWTVWTIGPCSCAHDGPPPSVDEVFSSTSALEVARKAAACDYTTTIQYA